MRKQIRSAFGIFLVLVGALLALQTFGLLQGQVSNILSAVVLGGASLLCLWAYSRNRRFWWWLIPGITLLAIAALNILQLTAIQLTSGTEDLMVLGGIGLAFFAVYLSERTNWWTLIPGGLLLTLGAIGYIEDHPIEGLNTDGLLFLGMGITFLILYLIKTEYGRLGWAIYPAAALLVFGGAISFSDNPQVQKAIAPGVLILFGVYLLVAAARRNRRIVNPSPDAM